MPTPTEADQIYALHHDMYLEWFKISVIQNDITHEFKVSRYSDYTA